jgi:hypothetical protein
MEGRLVRVIFAFALAGAGGAYAQSAGTFRCVDEGGRSTYTNVKEEMAGKKCTAVVREVSVVPAQQAPTLQAKPSPAAPSRAADRRKILEEELNDEEKRLSEAREKLAEQQAIRGGDERNYQRVLDRLKPYVDAVEQHEKNIAQLRRELNAGR